MRELYQIKFSSCVWFAFDKNAAWHLERDKEGAWAVKYKSFLGERKKRVSGSDATALENKLKSLSLDAWETEYEDPLIEDGEEWQLYLQFVDGGEKTVRGQNGYPKNWRAFMRLQTWLKKQVEGAGKRWKAKKREKSNKNNGEEKMGLLWLAGVVVLFFYYVAKANR